MKSILNYFYAVYEAVLFFSLPIYLVMIVRMYEPLTFV